MELGGCQREQAASCCGPTVSTLITEKSRLYCQSLIQLSCLQDVCKELRENGVCFVRINSSDVLAPKFYL